MAENTRIKTKYPGVYYREVKRISGTGMERVYYIVFKKAGKVYEEKVGKQYADDMTPAKASAIRAQRIEGKRASRKEQREAEEAALLAQKKKMTIGKIWEEYQTINSEKRSLVTDRYNFKNHVSDFADIKPEDITTYDIQKFRHKLELKNLSPASVRHMLVLLRMLINWGAKNNLCPAIDSSKLQFDLPALDNEKTEMLSNNEIVKYLEAIDREPDQDAAAVLRLALVTGMRKSAILSMRWDDCDFNNRTIMLRGEVAKKKKTEKIPMNEATFNILKSIKKTQNEYIFPGKNGGHRKEIRRIAQRVKKNAGLPADFRPVHGLRHAYASLLASSGKVDLYTLQKLLTHSSPQMTQRYAHLADEALKRAAGVADGLFLPNGKDSKAQSE